MKPFAIFSVYETVDEYGKRGNFIGTTLNVDLAADMAKGKGAYGDGDVSYEWFIESEPGVYIRVVSPYPVSIDVEALRRTDALRQSAMSKLTEDEKKVLKL